MRLRTSRASLALTSVVLATGCASQSQPRVIESAPVPPAQVAAYSPVVTASPTQQPEPAAESEAAREASRPTEEARGGKAPHPTCAAMTDVGNRGRWPAERYRVVAHHLSCHPEALPSAGSVFFGGESDVVASSCNQTVFQRKDVLLDEAAGALAFRLEPAVTTLKPCPAPELRTLALIESGLAASERIGYRGETLFLLDRAGVPLLELVPESAPGEAR